MISLALTKQRGVGLIEVLVTVLILATSLLAMGALQARSLQYNHSAYLRSQANLMAYDILDRMRINRENCEEYERDYDDAAPLGASLANEDLREWLGIVSTSLPGGTASIECTDVGGGGTGWICSVGVRWIEQDDTPGAEFDADNPATATFTYTTRI